MRQRVGSRADNLKDFSKALKNTDHPLSKWVENWHNSGMTTAGEPPLPSSGEVTMLLEAVNGGDKIAAEKLLPLVYEELRKLARSRMGSERVDHTLDATALVHEAYLRLVGPGDKPSWDNRGHFFGAAAEAMRRILVDRARARASLKRGGDKKRVGLEQEPSASTDDYESVLEIDELLKTLETQDPRKARIVTLRFFGGLTNEETALALGISATTVKNEWNFTRAWLQREITRRRGESA